MMNLLNTKHKERGFGYKPRYYDPDKEALDLRLKRRRISNNDKGEISKARIRQEFRHIKRNPIGSKSFVKSSSFRLIGIIVILLVFSLVVLDQLLPAFMTYLFPEMHVEQELLDEFY